MRTIQTNYFLIIFSFIVGVFLTIIPLPDWAIWLRPQWLFAILLFWVITSPAQCGIGLAFMVGILMDLVTGTAVGEHAIVFVILTYVILKLHSAIAHFPLAQQAATIALFAIFNAVLQGFILGVAGHDSHITLYALSAFTTAIIWPWLFMLLDRMRPTAYLR